MGDAADDYYDALERRAARADMARDWIIENCPRSDCSARCFRDEEGLLTCRDCGESFDD